MKSDLPPAASTLDATFGTDVYRAMVEEAPDALVMIDESGTIRLVNRQVEAMFGFPREELVGKSVDVLLPQRFRDGHQQHRNDYFHQPKFRAMGSGRELYAQRFDGQEFPVEVSLSPIHTPAGEMVLSAIRDVTEATQARRIMQYVSDQLKARNKALEQFTFLTSHDLQEPLRTIQSFSTLLRKELGDKVEGSVDTVMGYIDESATRMSRLLRELLEHSRIGNLSAFDAVDLNTVLGDVVKDLYAAIDDSHAQVEVGDLPTVRGRRAELHLLFQNLISNAIKFRKAGEVPKIHIAAKAEVEGERDGWEFTISDNSIGIDPEQTGKIFLPFQRLHGRTEYAGLGMGLAHCNKVVELHGGRIWVEPNVPQGSVFHIFLPAEPMEKAPV